jgi:hypothetical protein
MISSGVVSDVDISMGDEGTVPSRGRSSWISTLHRPKMCWYVGELEGASLVRTHK